MVVGGVALARVARGPLAAARASMSRSSMPGARSYDLASRPFLGPVFDGISGEVASTAPPGAAVLDVGCGPGHLAIRLARRGGGLSVSGVDLDPATIARADANVARAFRRDDPRRPDFQVGDVAALPFPDRSFDLVVSTFSMHHWSDPAGGLAELYRVLLPGGRALIWDLAGPLRFLEKRGSGPAEAALGSPFGSLTMAGRWGLGPLVLAERYDLVRPADGGVVASSGATSTSGNRARR
jgi:ubiquinone/menaquinone biosynthesis C-methylase UbiE